jgi:hypothetical protein
MKTSGQLCIPACVPSFHRAELIAARQVSEQVWTQRIREYVVARVGNVTSVRQSSSTWPNQYTDKAIQYYSLWLHM